MAGVKGRSGGARKGAGRKPAEPVIVDSPSLVTGGKPAEFLASVIEDANVDIKVRVDAAKALLSHEARMSDAKGVKNKRAEAAKNASGGKFAPSAPPRLVVNNR